MEIKVSVICPIYNMSMYLPECLDSIINQSLKEIEIIAVNDGSVDNSLDILKKYQEKYKNIVIINQENQGAGIARNNGIKRAKGKYIIFIDPDDYYPNSNCLEALFNAAEKYHMLICGGGIMYNHNGEKSQQCIAGREEITTNTIIKLEDYREIYGHTRYLFRLSLIRDNNICFPSYCRFQDQPFTVKALICAGEFMEITDVVYEYRIGYKRVEFTQEKYIDTLMGIRDVYQLAADNNLRKMYDSRLKNILTDSLLFYKYANSGNEDINRLVEEINQISEKWLGVGCTLEKAKDINLYKEKYDEIKQILNKNQQIILYGAGDYASAFLKIFQENIKNIIGIAVSKKSQESKEKISNLEVRQINEYKMYSDEVLVIIAVSSEYQDKIERNLHDLNFKKIYTVENKSIRMMLALQGIQ